MNPPLDVRAIGENASETLASWMQRRDIPPVIIRDRSQLKIDLERSICDVKRNNQGQVWGMRAYEYFVTTGGETGDADVLEVFAHYAQQENDPRLSPLNIEISANSDRLWSGKPVMPDAYGACLERLVEDLRPIVAQGIGAIVRVDDMAAAVALDRILSSNRDIDAQTLSVTFTASPVSDRALLIPKELTVRGPLAFRGGCELISASGQFEGQIAEVFKRQFGDELSQLAHLVGCLPYEDAVTHARRFSTNAEMSIASFPSGADLDYEWTLTTVLAANR